MFLKCDEIFRSRTDNFSKLRKVLIDHKVGEGPDDEISVNRRGACQYTLAIFGARDARTQQSVLERQAARRGKTTRWSIWPQERGGHDASRS